MSKCVNAIFPSKIFTLFETSCHAICVIKHLISTGTHPQVLSGSRSTHFPRRQPLYPPPPLPWPVSQHKTSINQFDFNNSLVSGRIDIRGYLRVSGLSYISTQQMFQKHTARPWVAVTWDLRLWSLQDMTRKSRDHWTLTMRNSRNCLPFKRHFLLPQKPNVEKWNLKDVKWEQFNSLFIIERKRKEKENLIRVSNTAGFDF